MEKATEKEMKHEKQEEKPTDCGICNFKSKHKSLVMKHVSEKHIAQNNGKQSLPQVEDLFSCDHCGFESESKCEVDAHTKSRAEQNCCPSLQQNKKEGKTCEPDTNVEINEPKKAIEASESRKMEETSETNKEEENQSNKEDETRKSQPVTDCKTQLIETVVICGTCANSFENIDECMNHMKNHETHRNNCNECDEIFETELDLEWHAETEHVESQQSKCKECDFQPNSGRELNVHKQTMHMNLKVKFIKLTKVLLHAVNMNTSVDTTYK